MSHLIKYKEIISRCQAPMYDPIKVNGHTFYKPQHLSMWAVCYNTTTTAMRLHIEMRAWDHIAKFGHARFLRCSDERRGTLIEVLSIDGQGGGIGKAIVLKLKKTSPGTRITAIGTNGTATAAKKVLIPVERCNAHAVGLSSLTLDEAAGEAVVLDIERTLTLRYRLLTAGNMMRKTEIHHGTEN